MTVKRGDIYYADLSPVIGSEQGGLRPVLIIQNDIGNKYSPTVIAAAITSRLGKNRLPTHIDVCRHDTEDEENYGLSKNSVILLEQIRTLDKRRLKEKMGHLDERVMRQVNDAISISFGLGEGSSAYEDEASSDEMPRAVPASASYGSVSDEQIISKERAKEQNS
ncbi:MAG: type II toxin-antitoxin system PemK/MazF family toxin [Clostridia bacterium]|nr:type II toxin-antitoxin system PemK/MazF family toxin [Clostridia bacterium]MBQ5601281.1 type II toxin-antitoxin system PemK/MazF family toxin [Clostridia bacterium]